MINTIGVIGGFLFFVKVYLHVYLSSKTERKIPWWSIGSFSPPEMLVHYFEPAPKGYEWLKKTINIIYAAAVLCIIIFLIGINSKYFF